MRPSSTVGWTRVVPLVLTAALGAGPSLGQDAEELRREIGAFVGELAAQGTFDEGQLAAVQKSLATMDDAQLAKLGSGLGRVSAWRQLPQVVGALDGIRLESRQRALRRFRSAASQVPEEEELELFRDDLLFFLTSLRAYAPIVEDPAFELRLDELERTIAALPVDQLPHLYEAFYRNAPAWKAALSGASAPAPRLAKRQQRLAPKDFIPTLPFEEISCSLGCGACDSLGCDSCDFTDCDADCRGAFSACSKSDCDCEDTFFGEVCDPVCLTEVGLCQTCIAGCQASEDVCREGCETAADVCRVGCEAAESVCGALNDVIAEVVAAINQVTSFLDDFLEDVGMVFDDIAALPGEVEGFFTGLFDQVAGALTGLFDDLLDQFPTSPASALAALGIDPDDVEGFLVDLASNVPILDLPCPAIDTTIPGFGVVGSPQAEFVCKRGVDWIAALIYDLVPDDIFGLPAKIPATIVYYPINYFCLCLEAQSAISFNDAQTAHRSFVAARLDATLASRASQTSVDALQSSSIALLGATSGLASSVGGVQSGLVDLDLDVAGVEAKLDVGLDAPVSTVATQDSVDDVQGDTDAVEVKLDVLGEKAGELLETGTLQDELLEVFQELMVRIRMEEALLEPPNAGDSHGLMQLPEALGGLLEELRETVSETIDMNAAAGEDVSAALVELAAGDEDLAAGAFEAAFVHYRKAYHQAVRQGTE